MARRMIAASPGGFYEDNGQRMPLPSLNASWTNPNTGRVWHAAIDENQGYWVEAPPIYQPRKTPQQPTEQSTMSAIERFTNLDQILADARREAQTEIQSKDERIFQLETENTLLREQNRDARAAEKVAERLTVKLLTQFALVEKIFSDVKQQAIELQQQENDDQKQERELPLATDDHSEFIPKEELAGSTDDPPHGEQPEPPPVPSRGTRKLREG